MGSSSNECRAFVAAQGADAVPTAELETALRAVLEHVRAAWPHLQDHGVGFAAFLGHRLPSDIPIGDALRGRSFEDLYIAHACLAGDPAAMQHFEDRYLAPLVGLLVQQGLSQDLARDTVQQLRMQLVTGERPLLRSYSGLGALKAWLRITTLREAIRAQRKSRVREGEELSEALADSTADPALQYQRQLYSSEFRIAFAEAVANLSVRERNLLRQSVLYGATVDDLGALYHVHRATAARWITAARERLAELTRARMIELLGIKPEEYDSILTLIHSQLDVSVERVLGDKRSA